MKQTLTVLGMLVGSSFTLLSFTEPLSAQIQDLRLKAVVQQEQLGPPQPIAQQNWSTHNGANGLYQISFPAPPERETRQVLTDYGEVMTTILLYEDPQQGLVLMSASNPLPVPSGMEIDAELGLSGGRDGLVESLNARIEREERLTVQGRPARSILASTPDQFNLLVVLVLDPDAGVLYQLMVGGSRTAMGSPDAERFLNSFRIR